MPRATWSVEDAGKQLFLTFDDGPHPEITPFVLEELRKFNAKASFFCIGNNVVKYPDVYRKVIDEGHTVGNHSYHHLNGWRTRDKLYLEDISLAKKYIDSRLYRPPYGKITPFQSARLTRPSFDMQIIMWSVLSGDFDPGISNDRCLDNVLLNTGDGDIVVFHDSVKAFERMRYALPRVLAYYAEKGYRFSRIEQGTS